MRALPFAFLLAGTLALLPSRASADEADEILARSIANAKALAAKFPSADRLGSDWLLPWKLPAESGRSVTEAAFWDAFERGSLPAGITESHAKAMAESAAANAAQVQIPGFTARTAMINLLRSLRGQMGTSAEKASDTADEMLAQEASAKTAAPRTPEALAASQEQFFRLLAAPYEVLDDAALKKAFVAQTTRVAQRTRLEYLRSNDWAKSKGSTLPAGVWVGAVTVTLSIVADGRLGEVPDVKPEHVAALEKKYDDGFRARHASVAPDRLKSVKGRIERLGKDIEAVAAGPSGGGEESAADRTSRLQRVEGFRQERADLEKQVPALERPPRMKVLPRQFGDNSYVLRLSNAMPDLLGPSVSVYTGWLRNGPALVEIKLSGTFPEAEMDKTMDHFLHEMDAATDVWRE